MYPPHPLYLLQCCIIELIVSHRPDITVADIIVTAGSSGSIWGCPPHFKESATGAARVAFDPADPMPMNDADVWIKNLNIDPVKINAIAGLLIIRRLLCSLVITPLLLVHFPGVFWNIKALLL